MCVIKEEKDLGVIVCQNLKVGRQCFKAALKGNQVIGMIKRTFTQISFIWLIWLTGRQQRVVINGQQSAWMEFTSGVPQGSVLGPTLFTIFIIDLKDDIKSNILKFADDVKLIGRMGSEDDKRDAACSPRSACGISCRPRLC